MEEQIALCGTDGEHERITVYMTADDSRRIVEWLKEQRKTGYWEWKTFDYYRCSECGHETNVDECMEKPIYNYCPYCGAKMLYRKSGYHHPQIPHPIDSNTQWT